MTREQIIARIEQAIRETRRGADTYMASMIAANEIIAAHGAQAECGKSSEARDEAIANFIACFTNGDPDPRDVECFKKGYDAAHIAPRSLTEEAAYKVWASVAPYGTALEPETIVAFVRATEQALKEGK